MHLDETALHINLVNMQHVLDHEQFLRRVVPLRVPEAYEVGESHHHGVLDIMKFEMVGPLVLAQCVLPDNTPHLDIFGSLTQLFLDIRFLIQISIIKLQADHRSNLQEFKSRLHWHVLVIEFVIESVQDGGNLLICDAWPLV